MLSLDSEFVGAAKIPTGHRKRVTDLKCYDDQILTCSEDYKLKICDLRANKVASEFWHLKELHSLAKSNFTLAAGDNEGSIIFWDLRTTKILTTYQEYHMDEVTA